MVWLSVVTAFVNLAGLVLSLWLGLYLVTRSARSKIAWMGALTMWSVGSWFLHNALQGSITTRVWTDWLGQVMKLSIPLWFHLACLLRFAVAPPRPTVRRTVYALIGLGYALIVYQALESSGLFGANVIDRNDGLALFFADRWTTGSFPIFFGLLLLLPGLAIVFLVQGWREAHHPLPRRQLGFLIVATLIAYVGAVYAAVGVLFQASLPVFPADAILAVSIFVLGYAVAGYNALLAGRPVVADATYSALGLFTVVALYSLVTLVLYRGDHITLQALVGVLITAIVTHALYDGGRSLLDRLFYQSNSQRMRAEFRALAAEIGQVESLTRQLTHLLERLCSNLGIKDALIAVREPDALVVQAATVAEWRTQAWPLAEAEELGLLGDMVTTPQSPELQELALLAPLPGEKGPIGVLGLGPKTSGFPLRLEDLEYVETLVPQLALMIWEARLQSTRAQDLDRLAAQFREREREYLILIAELKARQRPDPAPHPAPPTLDRLRDQLVPLVEDALRHLQDYAYLGRHSLVDLQIVQTYLPAKDAAKQIGITHVDRGKALHALLVKAIQALQPGDGKLAPPGRHDIAPREWHAYLILNDCYVLGESTNEIRARLYIGEGTYNRIRRAALKSVATIVEELEQAQIDAAAPAAVEAADQPAPA